MLRNFAFLVLSIAVLTPGMLAAPLSSALEPQTDAQDAAIPDAPSPSQAPLPHQDRPGAPKDQNLEGKQTRRILGIIPNFRSVSVDEKLPPISTRDKFKLMLDDNFDYSNFIFVGILAGVGQAEDSYPEFHNGAPAYARYYWHSFADTADGNLMVEFLFPVATHEDPRYYTLGRGGFVKRTGYSFSRLLITRNDRGGATPNFSEVIGNGASSGISGLYYPSPERTWTKTGQRWITQIGLDGFANLVKEFWPDLNSRIFHNQD